MAQILKWSAWLAGGVLLVILAIAGVTFVWYLRSDFRQPETKIDLDDYPLTTHEGWVECRGNKLRRSQNGLWEAYVHGSPTERGTSLGVMTAELLRYQEEVFMAQIDSLIPSQRYRGFLRYLLAGFNRNLADHVTPEMREEIYGIAQSCSRDFDAIGTPYERQLNYHAAHDIGHTMQAWMLVGCSSLAAWGGASEDGGLIVGRNFDFWVGDDFARNKIVAFYAPQKGYRFASVTWAGMTGVLSGMNERGLTVTINAAKGSVPVRSAMPISLLAREILQYAATIDQALEIAKKRETFVSESLLIGSAEDGCAAIIEKTPSRTALYRPSGQDFLICTNHFQSPDFSEDKHNVDNISTSDSPWRHRRIAELIDSLPPLGPAHTAAILRDHRGTGGRDAGLTNEMTVNQSIAHHSVIFRPERGLMWVSAGPWQSGKYVCYDLNRIFAEPDFSGEICVESLEIPADSAFMADDYPRVLLQRELTATIRRAQQALDPALIEKYIANNPEYYLVWSTLGDYYVRLRLPAKASECYAAALTKSIPTLGHRQAIEKKLRKTGKR